jgi:catechol 2,3-dioxygenase-like lactoylglutathione lyase family enzyme
MCLVSPDQATPEDDGEVDGGLLARSQGAGAGVHVESGRLELRDEQRLTRRQDEDPMAVVVHEGNFSHPPDVQSLGYGYWNGYAGEGMQVNSLDHVALWVDDRDAVADFAGEHLGMHVIDRTDAFTLVGADARRGKLTLFAAEGPREQGVLSEIAIRIPAGSDALPPAPAGVPLVAVQSEGEPYDLDHVTFRVPDPEVAFSELATLGFQVEGGRLRAGEAYVDLERGQPAETERPILNHLGLLVDSTEDHIAEARRRGLDIDNIVDAANTYALFVWGPSGIKLEYVEHKPTFSLV